MPAGLRVALLNWRDTWHPEGGGSERFLERIAVALVERGHQVTIVCADHGRRPRDEVVAGVRFVRRGGRVSVYPQAARALHAETGPVDVVVDVQNGVPFLSPLTVDRPVVVLVHHVHREQWPVVLGPVLSRVGWWVESRLAPHVYRSCRYVTVSDASRADLVALGVAADRITVIHNGSDDRPVPGVPRAATPTVTVLGRLVPHKQVEHALRALRLLRQSVGHVHLDVVGDGWWRPTLESVADELGIRGTVTFHGHVTESQKHELLGRSWVLAVPSLKEGWGLVVTEAARHGVPAVGYTTAGGLNESIVDGESGLLVADEPGLAAALGRLLADEPLRGRLGAGARRLAARWTWEDAADAFEDVLLECVATDGRAAQRVP